MILIGGINLAQDLGSDIELGSNRSMLFSILQHLESMLSTMHARLIAKLSRAVLELTCII